MSSSQPGLYRQKKEKKRERERNPIQNKVLWTVCAKILENSDERSKFLEKHIYQLTQEIKHLRSNMTQKEKLPPKENYCV
jgi:hypothetical protein